MTYRAKNEQLLLFVSLLLILLSILQPVKWATMFLIASCICLVVFLAISYTLDIQPTTIHYRITLFRWTLYSKELTPPMIHTVRFQRSGWQSKLAVIHHDGIPLRIQRFLPPTVYDDLCTFCEHHHISYTKTRDYLIVEKLHARK